MIDVRRALLSLGVPAPGDAEIHPRLARLEWGESGEPCDGSRLLEFQLAISTDGSAKPVEVIAALFGAAVAAETPIARVGLWADEGGRLLDPMDVTAFRHYPSNAAAPCVDGVARVEALGADVRSVPGWEGLAAPDVGA